MARISLLQRGLIALIGYSVLAVFGTIYFVLKRQSSNFTTTQALVISAVAVAPLVLALVWEHLKGVKVGQVEITLTEVAPTLHVELASQIQALEASVPVALTNAMQAAIGQKEFRLVEINLRTSSYWWSTRLYLLAALAQEYTNIERLVFVEQDAARVFIGMAAPAGVRRALAKRFQEYETVFRQVRQSVVAARWPDLVSEMQAVVNQWSTSVMFTPLAGGTARVSEKDVKELTARPQLLEWLGEALETESRQWSGKLPTTSLYGKILSCAHPYVPLLNGARLEIVVNRAELASKLAVSVVS
ncbi:MAG: hypothetical protein WB608_07865 [Terracidiphilus sp.]